MNINLCEMKTTIEVDVVEYFHRIHPRIDKITLHQNITDQIIDKVGRGYEVVGFLDGNSVTDKSWIFIGSSGDHTLTMPGARFDLVEFPYRIFLKPKEKKYRYTTDGKLTEGKPGQFYICPNGKFMEYWLMPFDKRATPCLWFDREEVTE